MFKYIPVILTIIFCGTVATSAQDDSNTSELGLWQGGKASLNLFIEPGFLNGGLTSPTGGVISPRIQPGAYKLDTNPALLGDLKKFDFQINSRIGINNTLVSPFVDLQDDLNEDITTETNSFLTDPDNFQRTDNSQIIPTNLNNVSVGLPGGIKSFAISYPILDKTGIAISYSNTQLLDLNLNLNGLNTKLAQIEGTDDVSVRFDVLLNMAATLNTSIEMSTVSTGFGTTIFDQGDHEVMFGGTFKRYWIRNPRFLDSNLDGLVVVGFADERFFNDQDDPNINFSEGDNNQLFLNANGTFTDQSSGYRLGLYYRFRKKWGFSLTYADKPSLSMRDPAATSTAFLPVFVLGNDLIKDDLEFELDRLEANKPNLTTQRDISDLVRPLSFDLPSSLTIGLDIPFRDHTIALNFQQYTTDLRIALGEDAVGKKNATGLGLATDFVHTTKFDKGGLALIPLRLLLLDIDGLLLQSFKSYTEYRNPHISFGGSVMFGEGFKEGDTSEDLVDILDSPIPLGFSLGRRYTVFNGLNVGFNVISYPNIALTYSIGYSL